MSANDYRRADANPAIIDAVAAILARQWDPDGEIARAADAGTTWYAEHALTVVAMLAADAQATEIQRYLRQVEQQVLGPSLHPFELRREIAETIWRAVREPGAT
jgi:hypothetical protein